MADVYCDDTNGNDTTGTGTSGAPYQTLQKAVDNAARGDTIYIANTSAQVLSSALSFGTGYNATGTGETLITSWDNGGSLTLTVPGATGAVTAAKIDASGLTVGWATSVQPYITLSNLIVDSSNTSNSVSTNGYWNFLRCHFLATTKTSGFHVNSARRVIDCTFENYGVLSVTALIAGCFFNNVSSYAVYQSSQQILGNVFYSGSSYTGSNPLVDPGSPDSFIEGNTFISGSARTGPFVAARQDSYIANNVFQGASGVGGSGIDAESKHVIISNNIFYDCGPNVVNDSLARYYSPNVTATAALYTDAGTNQWEASSELSYSQRDTGFVETSTQNYRDAGAITHKITAGGATLASDARIERLK